MNAQLTYRPGSWFGVFGDHATVLLPPSEKARVAALWERVDDGAGFGEVLDTLIAGGLRDLPGFVLVSDTEGTTQVVLRGPARATFVSGGETVELDGATAATWVERSLADVSAMTIELEEAAAYAEDLGTLGGLARVGRVSAGDPASADGEPAAEEAAAAPAVAVAAPPVEPVVVEDEADDSWDDEWDDQPPESEPASDVAEDEGEDEDDDRPVPPPYQPPAEDDSPWEGQETEAFAAVTDHEPDAGSSPPGSYADVDGAPPISAAAPAGSFTDRAGVPPLSGTGGAGHYTDSQGRDAAAAESEDHDGMTQAGAWEPGQFARPQPGIPGQPPAPQVTSRPVARLAFSHGETVDVDRAVLVGRAPEARRFSSTDQPRLVTVPSPHQEISSTHLEIRPGSGVDHGTAVVTDMGSTNGTVLVQPGLAPEDLQPGIQVQLLPGAVVDLGDGLTITVTNP